MHIWYREIYFRVAPSVPKSRPPPLRESSAASLLCIWVATDVPKSSMTLFVGIWFHLILAFCPLTPSAASSPVSQEFESGRGVCQGFGLRTGVSRTRGIRLNNILNIWF